MEYDMRLAAGPATSGGGSFEQSEMLKTLTPAIRAYASANNGDLPTDPGQLSAYVTTPEEQAVLQKGIKMYEAASPEQRAFQLKMLQRLRLK
jgi:hypothetical protein